MSRTPPLIERLRSPGMHTLGGIARGSEALALMEMAKTLDRPIIYVASHDREMQLIAGTIEFFAPHTEVLTLPAWDCLPYDRMSPNSYITAERITTLSTLCKRTEKVPFLLLTTINALLQKLPPCHAMKQAVFTAEVNKPLDRDRLMEFLVHNGYRRVGKVMEPGEFATRGGIIDIFPPGYSEGLRLDLFGDVLESIRSFDPLTQVSSENVQHMSLHPVSEVLLHKDNISRFREGYRAQFGAVTKEDPVYEAISEGRSYPGMEHWLPLFYEQMDTVFDYVPDGLLVLGNQAKQAMEDRWELVGEYYDARVNAPKTKNMVSTPYHALPPELLYVMQDEWQTRSAERSIYNITPFANEAEVDFGMRSGRNLAAFRSQNGGPIYDILREEIITQRGRNRRVLLACYSEGSLRRMQSMLTEHDIHAVRIENWDERKHVSGKNVGLAVLPIEEGFETPDSFLYSEQDVLGERIIRTSRKKRKSEAFLSEAATFTEGELIVHREHGIGRFEGLVMLEVAGAKHDCLKLVYEGEDKLFLPVENIELLSRYGSEDEGARLDKLGGVAWQQRKAKLKERITMAADELLRTAAQRALRTATPLHSPSGMADEFAARFPYVETDDQARSIEDVTQDLGSGKAMDRLICGDVGFGKTEVALRAAFTATATPDQKTQVAVIAPTTLLARQHYKTFAERFQGMPVVVRPLSRLVSAKDAKQTREMIAEGKVDIVVGTHAVLSDQVRFQNLGLLIIDEEQHFGVAQKEKLKKLKADVHVLTLSATPIPRTLQMALTGVRELSLITTPPVDRIAIRTFVIPFDPVMVREAIMREYHRGGRTFCVVPRIKDIAEMQATLTELVPEVKLAVAHGQMTPTSLDQTMNDFYDGKFDVLLSTAIVESGLDIPTANTIIIHKAHMFGLSQLYQLRGRVGRSKIRAYAYFTLPHHKMLSATATKRLEVMQSLDTLGAGFSIASHDMDIRGFGNLLGEEQSGHVKEVGIELYQQMLEEAIAAARNQKSGAAPQPVAEEWSPQINIGMSVYIPESYVDDLSLRLGLYRRIATLQNEEEIHSFAAELVDRFGPLPEEVEHLLAVLRIKQLCRLANVERVDVGPKGVVLSFHNNKFAKPEALLAFISANAKHAKLRADHKLVLIREWKDEQQKLDGTHASLAEIAKLAA